MLTPERIVEQAQVLHEKYGFRNFKLKGGVLKGSEEMEAIRALKKAFPNGRINIDPNGAWSLAEAIELCKPCLLYTSVCSATAARCSSR